VENKSLAHLCC